jgi:prolipoprotein diacylglyceryltransferase
MYDHVLIVGLVLSCCAVFAWAFRVLPKDGWQVLAAVPKAKADANNWTGLNLTYYGFFVATAVTVSVTVMLALLAAVRIPLKESLALVGLALAASVPSARLVARLVEGKNHTFTIAGASFAGLILMSGILFGFNALFEQRVPMIPPMPVLAALGVAYALGEGLGRLACISFGCCYGKPLNQCGLWVQWLFRGRGFVFSGKTKKIAYESGLEGSEVVPIQAMSSVVLVSISLAGMIAFLEGWFDVSFLTAVVGSQTWRLFSETLRADYRGDGRISWYQLMSMAAIPYAVAVALLLPDAASPRPDLLNRLGSLWDPTVLIALQALWLTIFLYTGRSTVTGATLTFHVFRDKV